MGLFGFGNKSKYVDEPDNNLGNTEQKEAFFLNPDEAETLGDVEYMRKKSKIRRTFPKIKGSKGAELISEVSATEQTINKGNEVSMSKPADNNKSTSETFATNNGQRRRADSSMDMFRNMAKEIKK